MILIGTGTGIAAAILVVVIAHGAPTRQVPGHFPVALIVAVAGGQFPVPLLAVRPNPS